MIQGRVYHVFGLKVLLLFLKTASISFLFLLPGSIFIKTIQAQTELSINNLKELINSDVDANEKADYVNKVAMSYWHDNTDSSLNYSRLGLSLIKNGDLTPANEGKIYFVHGFTHTMSGNPDSVIYYMKKAEYIFRENKLEFMLNRTMEQLGNIYREVGRYEEAEVELKKALEYFKKTERYDQANSVLINLGSLYHDQNKFKASLEYYFEAVNYDSILNVPSLQAIEKLGIGNVFMGLGDLFYHIDKIKSMNYYQGSLGYLQESEKIFSQISHQTGVCYCKMAVMDVYIKLEEFDKAGSIYRNSDDCIESSDTRIVSTFMINKASMLVAEGKYNDALELLNDVENMKDQMIIPHVFYEGKALKAKILYELGQVNKAHQLADSAITWFVSNKQFVIAYPIQEEKSRWYSKSNDFDKAYESSTRANKIQDSIFSLANIELFKEASMKFENNFLTTRNKLLETNLLLNKTQIQYRNMIIILAVLASIIIGYVWYWMTKRNKYHNELLLLKTVQLEQENQLKQTRIEKSELNRKLKDEEMERYRIEAEIKEQEMVFKSLRQANLLLTNKSIKERLGPYQYKFNRKKDQEAFVDELESLCRDSAMDPLSDFEKMFTQMHSGFYEKLIEINPDLTRSELQMCALLRMNLPSKEIANLLNLSLSRVDQTRHQVRRKLNLDTTQSLTSFLILS